jgi:uncharacterized damage-inducible protein DinB
MNQDTAEAGAMHYQLKSIADIYAFNTLLVRCSVGDLSNDDAVKQWRGGKGSSISFLVGHLLASRYGLMKRFLVVKDNPYAELFGGSESAQGGETYPSIADLATAWDEATTQFEVMLEDLSEEQILATARGFPVPDQTGRGALMFLAWHESYHVGQIGLMRTECGYLSVQARLYESMEK